MYNVHIIILTITINCTYVLTLTSVNLLTQPSPAPYPISLPQSATVLHDLAAMEDLHSTLHEAAAHLYRLHPRAGKEAAERLLDRWGSTLSTRHTVDSSRVAHIQCMRIYNVLLSLGQSTQEVQYSAYYCMIVTLAVGLACNICSCTCQRTAPSVGVLLVLLSIPLLQSASAPRPSQSH